MAKKAQKTAQIAAAVTTLKRIMLEWTAKRVAEDIGEDRRTMLSDIIKSGWVMDAYVPIAEDAAKTGKRCQVQLRLTARLLVSLIRSNGRNRERVKANLADIAASMQKRYRPELTALAITKDGLVANAGHSTASILLVVAPLDVWRLLGLHSDMAMVGKGAEKESREVFTAPVKNGFRDFVAVTRDEEEGARPASGESDEDGKPIPFETERTDVRKLPIDGKLCEVDLWTDDEILDDIDRRIVAMIPEEDRYIQCVVNVDPSAVRDFDTVSRPRKGAEQIELFGPANMFCNSSNYFDSKLLQQVLRNVHLRSNTFPSEEKIGKEENSPTITVYGTPKGGGNLSADLFTAMFLANLRGLTESVDTAANGIGLTTHEDFAAIPMKDVLAVVVGCQDDTASAERLGKALRGGKNKILARLAGRLVTPMKDKHLYRRPDASEIQAHLAAVAIGTTYPKFESVLADYQDRVHHAPECRLAGWDRSAIDSELVAYSPEANGSTTQEDRKAAEDSGVSFALAEGAKLVDEYFGETSRLAEQFAAKRSYRKTGRKSTK